jgi:hypothetical protein
MGLDKVLAEAGPNWESWVKVPIREEKTFATEDTESTEEIKNLAADFHGSHGCSKPSAYRSRRSKVAVQECLHTDSGLSRMGLMSLLTLAP